MQKLSSRSFKSPLLPIEEIARVRTTPPEMGANAEAGVLIPSQGEPHLFAIQQM